MRALVLFLNLIIPIFIMIVGFSVLPWYEGDLTVQRVLNEILEYKWFFLIFLAVAYKTLWRSPKEKLSFDKEAFFSIMRIWLLSIPLSLLILFFYYNFTPKTWEFFVEIPWQVREIRLYRITFSDSWEEGVISIFNNGDKCILRHEWCLL